MTPLPLASPDPTEHGVAIRGENAPRLLAIPSLVVAFAALFAWALAKEHSIAPSMRWFMNLDPIDLRVYDVAATHLRHGGDLYSTNFVGDLPFTYPPFACVFFLPFTWTDQVVRVTLLWQGLNFLCLATVILLVIRRFFKSTPATLLLALVMAAGCFMLSPVRHNFFYGQINCLLMFLVALDFLPSRHGEGRSPGYPNHWLVGVGTGLAAGLKLTPAFFILLFLIQHRFRAASVTVATFGVTVLIGLWKVPDATAFWTEAISDSSRIGEHTNRGAQSIRSLLYRTLNDVGADPAGSGASTLSTWWIGLSLLTVAVFAAGAWLGHRRGDVVFPFALAGVTACLISPFSWIHHWVWLAPLGIAGILGMVKIIQQRLLQASPAGSLSRSRWLLLQAIAIVVVTLAVVVFSPMAEWRYFPDLYIFAHRKDDTHWLNWMRTGIGFLALALYLVINLVLLRRHRAGTIRTGERPKP